MSLEIRALHKNYGKTTALRAVSYCFDAGKVTTILGPSGSGKSTLLAILSGLSKPDNGQVLWDGEDITAFPAERRNFGMVFQHYALFPNLNVVQNVEFGLRVRGVKSKARKIQAMEALERVKIPHLNTRRTDQLSGGEQQRVALARAIAIQPRCLLLDEPLSALDAQLRQELRVELQSLLSELSITTVFVTHDQSEALALGDELVIMNNGQIEQTGAPKEVYAQPATPFVAGFMGSANLLHANRIDSGGSTFVELPFCQVPVKLNGKRGPCWAMIRAEDLEIGSTHDSHFQAQVMSTSFLGNKVRLQLKSGDSHLILDGPNDLLNELQSEIAVRINTGKLSFIEKSEKGSES